MRKGAVAKRYAKALSELAAEEGTHEKFASELRDLVAAFKGSPELTKVLLNPMFKLEERLSLARAVAGKTGASETVKKFLSLLVETRKVSLLDDICAAYLVMDDARSERLRATVISSTEASSDFVDAVKKKLSGETGKEIILAKETDPALIGGFVIRIGNTMFDCSLKTQLERMREKILEGVV